MLTALLAAVPVALPATFTLAATLGAKTLALKGVLLTRLNALHEASMIDVLCADKTGTLTENSLAVAAVCAVNDDYRDDDVLGAAVLASSADGQDVVDRAIRAVVATRQVPTPSLTVQHFIPFDPAKKLAEATVVDDGGRVLRIVKGAPQAVAALAPMSLQANEALDRFTAAGYRTLAVASGPPEAMKLVGLIALSDPPRADSRRLLSELRYPFSVLPPRLSLTVSLLLSTHSVRPSKVTLT